jgi:hypothetical protein
MANDNVISLFREYFVDYTIVIVLGQIDPISLPVTETPVLVDRMSSPPSGLLPQSQSRPSAQSWQQKYCLLTYTGAPTISTPQPSHKWISSMSDMAASLGYL